MLFVFLNRYFFVVVVVDHLTGVCNKKWEIQNLNDGQMGGVGWRDFFVIF